MKKIFLLFAILLANSVFISCTELDENLGDEPDEIEVLATGEDDEQDPVEEEDPSNGG